MTQPNIAQIKAGADELERLFGDFSDEKLALDMTRGKPSPEQLDLANGLLTVLGSDFRSQDGTDCRNYGGVDGLPETKALFAEFLGAAPSEVLIGDNASLALMHGSVSRALLHGVLGGEPWSKIQAKFVCPTPGYDRHFAICEDFGIEMLSVDMGATGPDMAQVEKLVAEDSSVKGIWVVPKYSNPTGHTCSAETVERLASMKTAAPDFRIFWDNAYAHHDLTDDPPKLENLLAACKAAGNPNRVLVFGSTSKISFAGAGLCAMAASEENIAWVQAHRSKQTIGPDKLNQLRHVRFFRDMAGIRSHMKEHAKLLAPKFAAVDRVLSEELGALGIATWTKPSGGYFVSLDTLDGCAQDVVAMAAGVGVKLTEAGATFPYGKDPRNRNIRIAPSLPSLPEIETATRVLAVCIQRVTLRRF